MAHPWANVFILIVGGLSLLSGFLGLIGGSPDWTIALDAHRISGFALVALLLWKGRNVLISLTNRARWRRKPALLLSSVAILLLLLAALTLGIGWSYSGYFAYLGFSGVSWHIYLSLLLAPFVAWHAFTHSWTLRTRFWVERRSFLRLAGLTIAGLALWRAGELAVNVLNLPGEDRRFTGSYERRSFTGNAFPTTSWLNDDPEPVNEDVWRLHVSGLVRHDVTLKLSDLTRSREKVTAVLDCTGGWHSTQEWEGMPLKDVLQSAGVESGAGSVTVRSVTGFQRRFSLKEADKYLLATHVGGEPISHGHGFPVRLAAPGKRGFEWIKWVDSIHVNDTGKWWQPPVPLT